MSVSKCGQHTADHEIASRLLEVHRLDTVDDRIGSPGRNRPAGGIARQRKVLQDPRVGSAVDEVCRIVDQRRKRSEGREIQAGRSRLNVSQFAAWAVNQDLMEAGNDEAHRSAGIDFRFEREHQVNVASAGFKLAH